ncbi:MAG: OmpA family protein [Salibacteraceae bacterium]
MLQKITFAFLALLLIQVSGFTQSELTDNEQEKILKQARNYAYAGEWYEAFPLYSQLYKADTNNALYNYELGICIYEGTSNKLKSKKHFEKVVELNEREEKPELFYYLGRLYHLEHDFLFATASYNTYLVEGLPPGKLGKEMQAEVEAYILQCEDGKDLIESQNHILEDVEHKSKDITKYQIDSLSYISFENLGEEMNSQFDDYGPIIMDNNEVLLITSRRTGSTGGELFSDGQYYEDIYIANFRNGIWAEINNVNNTDYFNGALLNTSAHNATVSISPDETQLFVYTQNRCDMVEYGDKGWVAPQKFSANFSRAKKWVSNVTISPDGKVLYVEAERFDSYGGRDLYKSTLQEDSTWGEMQNLGPAINTEYDEVSPFLLNDTTLYFSSQGHSSIGGWDVFVSHKSDTGWSKPSNLGIPINTPYDEVNYMVSKDLNKSYYSSNREGGYGRFDIYAIVESVEREIDEEMIEELDKIDPLAPGVIVVQVETDVNGQLTAESQQELDKAYAKMEKNPNLNLEIVAVYADENDKANAVKGAEIAKDYAIGKGIDANKISLTYKSTTISGSNNDAPLVSKYEESIYFGNNSFLVTDYSKEKKMLPLLAHLKTNPSGIIYLSGHADHIGNEAYNIELSRKRADAVKKYLVENGVNNKIRVEYFGETSPHLPLEEVDGDPTKLIYNRRVKVVVF